MRAVTPGDHSCADRENWGHPIYVVVLPFKCGFAGLLCGIALRSLLKSPYPCRLPFAIPSRRRRPPRRVP